MRFFGLLAVVAGLASLASATSLTKREVNGINCEEAEIPCEFLTNPTELPTVTERSFEGLTNGQRLARGLPIKAPRRHTGTQIRRTDPSPVPSSTYRGKIRVERADGTGTLGYVSAHPFSGAQHRYQDESKAMIVSFTLPADATEASDFEIMTENSDIQDSYPLFGLVQGRDNANSDLSTGSFQYLYLAGTKSTPAGSTPQTVGNSYTTATGTSRTSESSVWSIDATGELKLTWINTDGTAATTQTWVQSTALYAGADSGAFVARYPSPIIPIKYKFVSL